MYRIRCVLGWLRLRKVKATALLERFGSKRIGLYNYILDALFIMLQVISNASIEELAEVTSRSHAQQIYNFFRAPM